MYKYVKDFVDKSKYLIKCPYSMNPACIVVHNTANDASAKNEIAYMKRNDNYTSYHFAIDDIEVRQALPLDRNGWHAGDGNGDGNRKGIGIEICYSKSGGEKFIKAEKNAADFIATLLIERGWGINKVTKHQNYSGKYCPHRTLDMGWKRFLDMVEDCLNTPQVEIQPSIEDCTQELYWRNIILNKELWDSKARDDDDIRWLLSKYYKYIMVNGGSVKNLLYIRNIDDGIRILYNHKIMSDTVKWKWKSDNDKNVYWLIMKMADYIN